MIKIERTREGHKHEPPTGERARSLLGGQQNSWDSRSSHFRDVKAKKEERGKKEVLDGLSTSLRGESAEGYDTRYTAQSKVTR